MRVLLVQAAWRESGADFAALDAVAARGWLPAGPRQRYNVVTGNLIESLLQSGTDINVIASCCVEVVSYVNISSSVV